MAEAEFPWRRTAAGAVVAVCTFLFGASSLWVRVVIAAIIAGAVVLDSLERHRGEKRHLAALREADSALRSANELATGRSLEALLRRSGRLLFEDDESWRVTLYVRSVDEWICVSRAASHEFYETGGRGHFKEAESFLVRFTSRNLSAGKFLTEPAIRLPNPKEFPDEWRKAQILEGNLAPVVADSLRMKTTVYCFGAERVSTPPHATLAVCAESSGSGDLDDVKLRRVLGETFLEAASELHKMTVAAGDAVASLRNAVEQLEPTAVAGRGARHRS